MATVTDTRVRQILTDHTILDGLRLRITTELDRPDYEAVNEVLTALTGRWNRAMQAHLFTVDPAGRLAAYLAGGPAPQPPKVTHGYVPTPAELADEIVDWHSEIRDLPAGAQVLEPSAGTGPLVWSILDANPQVKVTAVEPDVDRANAILAASAGHAGVAVALTTFEAYTASCHRRFDAVVMNPPFNLPGQPNVWIDHVLAAWELLAPGGVLTAIVPAGFRHRQDRCSQQMRGLVHEHGGFKPLAGDAFKASGVGISTVVIWLHKPIPVLDGQHRPWLWRDATDEPVRVDEPHVAGVDAATRPVQVWWDVWRRRDRVLRCVARCHGCLRAVWAFDDGENDPRGALGDASAGFSVDSFDDDRVGRPVGLCAMCGNEGDCYRAAREAGMQQWTTLAATMTAELPLPVADLTVARYEQDYLFDVGV